MSNLPPNPYTPGPQMNASMHQINHNQSFSPVPINQLPPGYGTLKQDTNSNSPLPPTSPLQNNAISHVNNYNLSGSNSPAFNNPGMVQPTISQQSVRMRTTMQPPLSSNQITLPNTSLPLSTSQSSNVNSSPIRYPPNYQHQINDNAPPLISSSHSRPANGPPVSAPANAMSQSNSQYPSASSAFSSTLGNKLITSAPPSSKPLGLNPMSPPSVAYGSTMQSRTSPLVSGPPISGTTTSGPPISGPTTSGPPISRPAAKSGPPMSGLPASSPSMSVPAMSGPPMSVPPMSGPPMSVPPMSGPPMGIPPKSGPPMSVPPISGPPMSGLPTFAPPKSGPPTSAPPISGPPISGQSMTGPVSGPSSFGQPFRGPVPGSTSFSGQPTSSLPSLPVSGPPIPGSFTSGSLSRTPVNVALSGPPIGSTTGPPLSRPMGVNGPNSVSGIPSSVAGPLPGPPKPQGIPPMAPPVSQGFPQNNGPPPFGSHGVSNMPGQQPPSSMPPFMPHGPQIPMRSQTDQIGQQPASAPLKNSRYPASNNIVNHYPSMQPQTQQPQPYLQQYNTQAVAQQMGQLSVTKQGFDQLWGHQMVDLMATRHILPEYPDDPPEIKLTHQFAESPNCSPEIFRCTINRIPETNNLLQKSRLPLGILIHPFKDLTHLPVIQCNTIVRCRACRTYINPFVYFVDGKRWKCNLCFRVNDLPEEFQYDPVSKSYGDPSRRPEIKSATIEFIAPGEYMLRPPQPAVYLFLMDVSQIARESGYLQIFCDTLKDKLDQLPGDARTQVGFLCYDAHVHCYLLGEGLTRPKEMTVLDIEDIFMPSPESLLVNLGERRELIRELLTVLPQRHTPPGSPGSALGAALQLAYKLMAPTGGRVTVFQTCLPNVGPGALEPREDPNARSSAEVSHLNPATDFYKRLALDCSGTQIAVDLFLLNSQYSDLATLSGVSRFSAGTVYHIPLFTAARRWQADLFTRMLTRYLTRKIGFEAVMRVRCTRGVSIHTFHGNFFVRSTDLLSLPNVSPDAGFGMQLTIEDTLSDLQQVCFQAALLYTSSKGERRIRVHTLALPIASNLTEVLFAADQQCIIGLLSKMAVDRCCVASLPEAREALSNVAVDALSAFRLAQNLPAGTVSASLHAPYSLRLLPLYLLALLKTKAFRCGTSTRLDDRVAFMCDLKTLPLPQLMRAVYPDLYPIHTLREHTPRADDVMEPPDPPRLQLTAERINSTGAYLLDDGFTMIIYVCHAVGGGFLSDTFGVTAFSQVVDEARSLPLVESEGNALLRAFIDKLNDDRPHASSILVLRDNSPNRQIFTERLVDDRVESAFAYYEFLNHVKNQVK